MQKYKLPDLPERELMGGFHGRFVHCDNMTLAFWRVEPDSAAPEHSHPHEQVFHLLEGRMELTVGEHCQTYEPGAVVVIPGDVPHSARSITECRVLDVFHPVREDIRDS
jgi:quercetin dioxygenase-like cupin family protein